MSVTKWSTLKVATSPEKSNRPGNVSPASVLVLHCLIKWVCFLNSKYRIF